VLKSTNESGSITTPEPIHSTEETKPVTTKASYKNKMIWKNC